MMTLALALALTVTLTGTLFILASLKVAQISDEIMKGMKHE